MKTMLPLYECEKTLVSVLESRHQQDKFTWNHVEPLMLSYRRHHPLDYDAQDFYRYRYPNICLGIAVLSGGFEDELVRCRSGVDRHALCVVYCRYQFVPQPRQFYWTKLRWLQVMTTLTLDPESR